MRAKRWSRVSNGSLLAQLRSIRPGGARFFVAMFLLYLATAPGSFESQDAVIRFETARSFLDGRGGALDESWAWNGAPRGRDGNVFTFFGFVQPLLMMPFLGAAEVLPIADELRTRTVTLAISLLLFPAVSAAACVVLRRTLVILGFEQRLALLATLCYGLGTAFWYYARVGQEESLVALGLAICLYGLARWTGGGAEGLLWLGAGIAITGCTRPFLGVALSLLVVAPFLWSGWQQMLAHRRQCLTAALVVAAGASAALAWNYYRFGSPFELGNGLYHAHFGEPPFVLEQMPGRLAALLFSPYRGLILYSPVLLLAIPGLRARRPGRARQVALVGALAFVLQLLAASAYYYWDGGHSWGPRYVVGASVLLVPAVALALARIRGVGIVVALAIAMQVPSLVLPVSTEHYVQYERNRSVQGTCGVWEPRCGAVFLRPGLAFEAMVNTITGDYGEIEQGSALSPARALGSSDFRTLIWWPIRLAIRFQVWNLWVGWCMVAAVLGAGFALLRRELTSPVGLESRPVGLAP